MTSDEVELGFIGLTVVFARRNETTPATQMSTPISARLAAKGNLAGRKTSNLGVAEEAIHMSAAPITTSPKGGNFNARPF